MKAQRVSDGDEAQKGSIITADNLLSSLHVEDAYGDTPPPPGVRALRMTWPWMKAMRRGMQVAMETTKL